MNARQIWMALVALALLDALEGDAPDLPPDASAAPPADGESDVDGTDGSEHDPGMTGAGEDQSAWTFFREDGPWLAPTAIHAVAIESSMIALGTMLWLWLGQGIGRSSAVWIAAHPVWAGTLAVACFALGVATGAWRQARMRWGARARQGRRPLGRHRRSKVNLLRSDVWETSPWPRALSSLAVALPSLAAAVIGAGLNGGRIGAGFVTLVCLILLGRWGLSTAITSHRAGQAWREPCRPADARPRGT